MDSSSDPARYACQSKMGHEISVSSKASLSFFLNFNPSTPVQLAPSVSIWQVATVVYLLASWKRRWLARRKTAQSQLDKDELTPNGADQMTEVFDDYPTTYFYRKFALAGKGSLSKVYRAMKVQVSAPLPLQSDNEWVALKEIIPSKLRPYDRKILTEEIKVMKILNHDNCIRLHEAVWEVGQDKAWIVMEYADRGDLTDLIGRAKLREDHIAAFCTEVSAPSWPIFRGRRFDHLEIGN
jgi:Protein kinase domain